MRSAASCENGPLANTAVSCQHEHADEHEHSEDGQ
jgi:hypothetical protein